MGRPYDLDFDRKNKSSWWSEHYAPALAAPPEQKAPLDRAFRGGIMVKHYFRMVLTGLSAEAASILPRMRELLEVGPIPDDFIGHRYYETGDYFTDLALVRWFDTADPATELWAEIHARDGFYDNAMSATPPSQQRFHFNFFVRNGLAETMAKAILGGKPGEAITLYHKCGLDDIVLPSKINTYAQMVNFIAHHHLDGRGSKRDVVKLGMRILTKYLVTNNLANGQDYYVMMLLRLVFWETGYAATPNEAILRALDCMRLDTRPEWALPPLEL